MRRIVPNIYSNDIERSKEFYSGFLEMKLAMDMGWILTFVSKENATAQISIFRNDENKALNNEAIFLSIEVSDIDVWYEKARKQKVEIVYPITNESWGVRRFFVKDPNGVTINLLSHINTN
ncbi:VOC family protein [Prolixibacter sp. NT017]|uniref:VOC family protein n=1 Tax=Prolixibacter sp. NT017 TaxID=2652390 RepID=UPI0012738830|nr:VOC family protein [Prolixibacter sp. NT017]GET25539.1 glyoxalase [Prolixibacter sp. NT017]